MFLVLVARVKATAPQPEAVASCVLLPRDNLPTLRGQRLQWGKWG